MSLKEYAGVVKEIYKDDGAKEAAKATGEVINTTALAVGGGIATYAAMVTVLQELSDAYNLSYDSAIKNTQASVENVESTKTEVDSLKNQVSEARSSLEALADEYNIEITGTESFDNLVTKLYESDLSLDDQIQVGSLDKQNAELERQLAIKEKLLEYNQKEAVSNAMDTLGRGEKSVAQTVAQDVPGGKNVHEDAISNVSVVDAVKDNVSAIQEYEKEIDRLENAQANYDPGSKKWEKAQEDIDSYNEAIQKLTSDIDAKTPELNSLLKAFSMDGEGTSALAGYEKQFNEVKSALDAINTMDMSPLERQMSQIESAFSATSGNDLIRDQLIEAAKSGEDVVDVLHEMGLTLSDLGIKGAGKGDAVRRYFDELAESAEQAQDAINSVDGSVEGVTAAFESANQDADWKTMSDYLSQASELYQQGKVGTDDFQTATQFMTYDTINADADGFKYDADAYVHYWEQAQGKVARYFDENNPIQSVSNALEDLKSAGLATELEGGDNDWTESFRTSADAAKAWGVSVDAAEAMMHNMESYGAEFDNVFWSGEGLSRYEEALTNLKTIRDEMSSGDGKNRLSGLIEGWDEEYTKYQNDLSGLTEDQVVRIEFEYDLASAQQQIDELDELWEGGDRSAETGAKRIAARSNALSLLEEQTGYSEEQGGGYANLSSAIDTLQDKLSKTDSKKSIANIQEQISAVQDLQQAFQTSMLDGEVANWDEYLNTDGFGEAIQSIMDSTDMSTSDLSELLGIDQNVLDEAVDLKVDADTSEAENKLQGIAANDGKHIVMDVDASTDQIQAQLDKLETGQTITFNAEVDGVDSVINAVKDEEGNITYTATIDGVEQKISPILNKDGTVSYTLGEVPTVLPDADQTVNRNPDNSKVSVNPSSVNQTAVRRPDNSSVMSSPPPVTQTVKRVVSTVVQGGLGVLGGIFNFNGTAHANGTVRIGTALASGDWSVQQNERALVGELGQETVVRDGHFFTVGDNGAEFVNLRRGDVVFNHKQSEELFKNGYVTSGGGRARVVGGSYAFGSAYANGFRFPSGGVSSGYGSSSSHKSSGSSSSSSSASKAATSAAKAASSASKAASSAAKAADEFKEKFDEVEIWLDRFDRTLNNLTDSIETYSYDLSKQSSVSDQAMNHIRNNLSTLQSAYNRYIQEANSVGLDSSWISKIQNGSINVETITDEDLKEKIDEYQDW